MRIRLPPQLIIFALGAAVAMAVPGLPRRHFEPPPLATGLEFSSTLGAPGWNDRIASHFPVGSSSDVFQRELHRQGFEVEVLDELSRNGQLIYANYIWPYGRQDRLSPWISEECLWIASVAAEADAEGVIRDRRGEVRITCSDTVQVWVS